MADVVGPNVPKTAFPAALSSNAAKKVYSEKELKTCKEMFGKYVDGVFVGIPTNCTMEKVSKALKGYLQNFLSSSLLSLANDQQE